MSVTELSRNFSSSSHDESVEKFLVSRGRRENGMSGRIVTKRRETKLFVLPPLRSKFANSSWIYRRISVGPFENASWKRERSKRLIATRRRKTTSFDDSLTTRRGTKVSRRVGQNGQGQRRLMLRVSTSVTVYKMFDRFLQTGIENQPCV